MTSLTLSPQWVRVVGRVWPTRPAVLSERHTHWPNSGLLAQTGVRVSDNRRGSTGTLGR